MDENTDEIARIINEYYTTHTLTQGSLIKAMSLTLEQYEKHLMGQRKDIRDLHRLMQERIEMMEYTKREALRWEKETKKMHKNYIKTRQRLRQVRTTSTVYQNALTDKDKETRALQEEVATLKAQLARTGLVKEVQDLKAELAIREKELGIRKFYGK